MDQYGQNLNRYYLTPDSTYQPAIYATKQLLDYYAVSLQKLALFLDLHAHSSKRGCFIYGNVMDSLEDQVQNQLFCKLIALNTPHFDYDGCLFSREHMSRIDPGEAESGLSAEGSGRVSTYLHHRLIHSYTLECNYNTGKTGNEVPPLDGDPGGKQTYFNQAFPQTTFPEKYTPTSYASVGQACLLALLDIRGHNPCSRVIKSRYKTLDRMRYVVLTEVKVRSEYKGHVPSTRRRISNSRMSPGTNAEDMIWKRVVLSNNGGSSGQSAHGQASPQDNERSSGKSDRYIVPHIANGDCGNSVTSSLPTQSSTSAGGLRQGAIPGPMDTVAVLKQQKLLQRATRNNSSGGLSVPPPPNKTLMLPGKVAVGDGIGDVVSSGSGAYGIATPPPQQLLTPFVKKASSERISSSTQSDGSAAVGGKVYCDDGLVHGHGGGILMVLGGSGQRGLSSKRPPRIQASGSGNENSWVVDPEFRDLQKKVNARRQNGDGNQEDQRPVGKVPGVQVGYNGSAGRPGGEGVDGTVAPNKGPGGNMLTPGSAGEGVGAPSGLRSTQRNVSVQSYCPSPTSSGSSGSPRVLSKSISSAAANIIGKSVPPLDKDALEVVSASHSNHSGSNSNSPGNSSKNSNGPPDSLVKNHQSSGQQRRIAECFEELCQDRVLHRKGEQQTKKNLTKASGDWSASAGGAARGVGYLPSSTTTSAYGNNCHQIMQPLSVTPYSSTPALAPLLARMSLNVLAPTLSSSPSSNSSTQSVSKSSVLVSTADRNQHTLHGLAKLQSQQLEQQIYSGLVSDALDSNSRYEHSGSCRAINAAGGDESPLDQYGLVDFCDRLLLLRTKNDERLSNAHAAEQEE